MRGARSGGRGPRAHAQSCTQGWAQHQGLPQLQVCQPHQKANEELYGEHRGLWVNPPLPPGLWWAAMLWGGWGEARGKARHSSPMTKTGIKAPQGTGMVVARADIQNWGQRQGSAGACWDLQPSSALASAPYPSLPAGLGMVRGRESWPGKGWVGVGSGQGACALL